MTFAEYRLWVLNTEMLYIDYKLSGLRLDKYVEANKDRLNEYIKSKVG